MYKQFIQENYDTLLKILNCVQVGIYITDSKGNTLFLNDESCKTGGLARSEVLGKNMKELEDMGFVENSASLRVIANGKEENIIQNLGDGGKMYVSGEPLYDRDKIDVVVCTERDITETFTLKNVLRKTDDDTIKVKEESEYLKRQNIILWGDLVAEDEKSKQLAESAKRIAATDATVMLTGESGTGKEVYANFIYENSNRKGKPFIKVNCAAIPDNLIESELFGYASGGAFTGADKKGKTGLFELANNGTLLLDEIGEIPLNLQPKLLRAIQEKEIIKVGGTDVIPLDVRIIASTNKDLKKAVDEGKFREDLYYRLNIVPIELLPLRRRKDDIPALATCLIEQFNKDYKLNKTITEDAIKALQQFDWPGNTRELENILERIMISFDGDVITKFQVERAIGVPVTELNKMPNTENKSMTDLLEQYEKNILKSMMEKYGSAKDVGEALKMNKSTLSRRLHKYGLAE